MFLGPLLLRFLQSILIAGIYKRKTGFWNVQIKILDNIGLSAKKGELKDA